MRLRWLAGGNNVEAGLKIGPGWLAGNTRSILEVLSKLMIGPE